MAHKCQFTSVVLAADRGTDDEVARASSTRCKAMAPVADTPMVFRVLRALQQSELINDKILCGPTGKVLEQEDTLSQFIAENNIVWIAPQATPSTSALAAMQTLPDNQPVLLTTADHALLNSGIIDFFCSRADADRYDVVVALVRHTTVSTAFPEQRRTRLRFRDDDYCGCNLFAFLTPASRRAAEIWKRAEQFRKQPFRIAGIFGINILLLYLLRRLSLDDALQRLSRKTGIRVGAVILPQAEAAVDVDTVNDWMFVNKLARATSHRNQSA